MIESVLRKTDDLIVRKYRELFVPTLLSSFAYYLGNILNGVIVGNLLGLDEMAAVCACMPLNQLATALALLFSIGSTGMIAIAAASREHDRADYIFSTVATLTLTVAALILVALLPITDALTEFLSSAPELRPDMREYLPLFAIHTALMLFIIVWRFLVKAEGLARIVSRSVAIQQVANVVLTFLFVGNFHLGIAGASGALVIGDVLGVVYLLINYRSSRDRGRKFVNVFGDGMKKFLAQSIEVMKSGASAALLSTLVAVKVWLIYQILGRLGGSEAMSCYALCMTLWSIGSMLTSSCTDSAMPIVSTLYSEKDFAGVRAMMRRLQRFVLILLGALVMLMWIYPEILLNVYGVDGVWYSFLTSAPIDALIILLYSRSVGSDIFLIDRLDPEVHFDVSLKANEESASRLSEQAYRVLRNDGFDVLEATRMGVALEEMVMNIATPAVERTAHVDVRIKLTADGRKFIVFRDDGTPFNPLLYRSLDGEELLMDEIEVLNALAKDVQYNRVLGLNQTVIEI
ncbi:MAG: hypothetical protein IJ668_05285 [Selenomonadaceae bacterium]|nr:hypothetical protein [Selenomonadaceae bacterium]